jgi:hypothetical protein
VFSDDYLRKIFAFLNIDYVEIDTSVKANSLTYIRNPILRELRIFIKSIRAINPKLFDNKVTRKLFTVFMKSVPVKEDASGELEKFKDLYMDYFTKYQKELTAEKK